MNAVYVVRPKADLDLDMVQSATLGVAQKKRDGSRRRRIIGFAKRVGEVHDDKGRVIKVLERPHPLKSQTPKGAPPNSKA